ncbi:hypothetical protein [Streptomyces microflavus]|uniref:hypothetical protein n=1 Tax=Streptomyces microflavus TaxID=1919 RepID=UPI003654E19D
MTTAVAVDCRSLLLGLRAAIRAVRENPGPSTLSALSGALLAFPTDEMGTFLVDGHGRVIGFAEMTERNPLFERINHMDDAVVDLTRQMPSWTPAYATVAIGDVMRLMAVCHDHRADMEEHPFDPWSRAAEAGTRLIGILVRRTDARQANDLMVRTAAEFAARLRSAVAANAVRGASQFAAEFARTTPGLFRIGARTPRSNGGMTEWTRIFGRTTYHFALCKPGWSEAYSDGYVAVRRGLDASVRIVPLTARTSRKAIDRFVSSL